MASYSQTQVELRLILAVLLILEILALIYRFQDQLFVIYYKNISTEDPKNRYLTHNEMTFRKAPFQHALKIMIEKL
ncbi:hypothetical protein BpHYR1_051180 [Brachionus plicatilis]|uniref:Uncharacterized protein n=1 Tax=Brachionus plicatilis TaxID=10195 RepID=A0A3M7S1F7_BRAPC|nr:hypothetical protein BpHYR1_051180 [Brachionus plicatilis]